jgi:hypothetical protein
MDDSFPHDVFLGYSCHDRDRVTRLAERLQAAGVRVWLDNWFIQAGDDITQVVGDALEAARTYVLCWSPSAAESEWLKFERASVLFRDPSNSERRLIPLLLSRCDLPTTLRHLAHVDYSEEREEEFQKLLTACKPDRRAAVARPSLAVHDFSPPKPEVEAPATGRGAAATSALEKPYLEWIIETFRCLPHDRHNLEIEHVYVRLRLQASRSFTPAAASTITDLGEALRETGSVVVLGGPGSGKTTLARQLARAAAKQRLDDSSSSRIPIFVSVPHYGNEDRAGGRLLPLAERLLATGEATPPTDGDGKGLAEESLHRWLREILKQEQALVILDGLDEIEDPLRRADVARFIDQFVEKFGKKPGLDRWNEIVVTSRRSGYDQAPMRSISHLCSLEPLNEAEIEEVADRLFIARYKHEDPAATPGAALTAKMEHFKSLLRLQPRHVAANPLLLRMLVDVYEAIGSLPSSRADLYDRTIRQLLWRVPGDRHQEIIAVAAKLALDLHGSAANGMIKSSDLDGLLASRPRLVSGVKSLLQPRGSNQGDWYGFAHRTYQEFLAGRALVQSGPEEIYRRWRDPHWREVVLLGLGSRGAEPAAFEALLASILDLDRSAARHWPWGAMLVCEVTRETGDAGTGCLERALQELLKVYSECQQAGICGEFLSYVEGTFTEVPEAKADCASRALLASLQAGPPALAQAAASILSRTGRPDMALGKALLDGLPRDGPGLNWPIQSALQQFVAAGDLEQACTGRGISIQEAEQLLDTGAIKVVSGFMAGSACAFRRPQRQPAVNPVWYERGTLRLALLGDHRLVGMVTRDPAWLRLIAALYGGFANFGTLGMKRGLMEQRAPAMSLTRQRAAELDASTLPHYHRLRVLPPRFLPGHLFRDSSLTLLIRRALERGTSPSALADGLTAALGDPHQREEALFALLVLGHGQSALASLDEDARRRLRWRLSSLIASLSDAIFRSSGLVVRLLLRGMSASPPGPLLAGLEAVLHVYVEATGEALDTLDLFLASSARDGAWRSKLLAEQWAFALCKEIPGHPSLMAARLDCFGGDFIRDGGVLVESLARLPEAVNLAAADSLAGGSLGSAPRRLDGHGSAAQAARQALKLLPDDLQVFREWALERLDRVSAGAQRELGLERVPNGQAPALLERSAGKLRGPAARWREEEDRLVALEAHLGLRADEIASWAVFRLAAWARGLIEDLSAMSGGAAPAIGGSLVILHEELDRRPGRLGDAGLLSSGQRLVELEALVRDGKAVEVGQVLCHVKGMLRDDERPVARRWLGSDNQLLSQGAALWLAEAGEWSVRGFDELICLFGGADCHGRGRVAVLFHGPLGAAGRLPASQLRRDVVEAIAGLDATVASEGLLVALRRFLARVEFDRAEWIDDWASAVAAHPEGASEQWRFLSGIRRATPEVWRRLAQHLGPAAPPKVQEAALRCFARKAAFGSGGEWFPDEVLGRVRELLASGDPDTGRAAARALGILGSTVEDLDALKRGLETSHCAAERFHGIGKVIQRNAEASVVQDWQGWLAGRCARPDHKVFAAAALVRTGFSAAALAELHLDAAVILDAHVHAADEITRPDCDVLARGCSFLRATTAEGRPSQLLELAFERWRETANDRGARGLQSIWLTLTSDFAKGDPDTFSATWKNLGDRRARGLRDCLFRAVRESDAIGRVAALTLIGQLRVADQASLEALSTALRDVPEVQRAALAACRFLDRPSTPGVPAVPTFLINQLAGEDALTALLAAGTLVSLAHGAELAVRDGFRDQVEQAFSEASQGPPRPVYQVAGEGWSTDPYRLQLLGQLPALCRRALLELQEVRGAGSRRPGGPAEALGWLQVGTPEAALEVALPDLPHGGPPLPFQRAANPDLPGDLLSSLRYLSSSAAAGHYSLHQLVELLRARASQ